MRPFGFLNLRTGGLLACLAALIAYPFATWILPPDQHEFLLQQLTSVMITGLLAMSLDLLVGVVGVVSLGHAAFYGLGAYFLVMVTPEYEAPSLLVEAPLAIAATALVALGVGALALRTSGVYLIMVTLAIGQMFFYLFNDSSIAGGSDGIYLYVRPNLTVDGVILVDFEDKRQFYFAAMAALVGGYVLLRTLLAAPFGKVIRGIGINEDRTGALGYDTYAYKLVAFTLAGALAGAAGVLGATQYGFVNPGMLGWHASGTLLVTVILGGMGTLIGPVFGAVVVELLRHVLEGLTSHWLLPFGGLIILMVLTMPRGLAGLPDQWRRGWKRLRPLIGRSEGVPCRPAPVKEVLP